MPCGSDGCLEDKCCGRSAKCKKWVACVLRTLNVPLALHPLFFYTADCHSSGRHNKFNWEMGAV